MSHDPRDLMKCPIRKAHDYSGSRTAQNMNFSIKDFFSKCDQNQFPTDLVTFTLEIFNLCSETSIINV